MKASENLSLAELIEVCKKTRDKNIEILSDPISRPKNYEFITKYELLTGDLCNIIRSLNANDYIKGPVPDYNPSLKAPCWIFIKHIRGIKVGIYIKLKVINKKTKIIVVSIHEEGLYD